MSTPELDLIAAVEAAAEATHTEDHGEPWEDAGMPTSEMYRYMARAAIEAALPHLLAQITEGVAVAVGGHMHVAEHYACEVCETVIQCAAIARNCWRKP